MRQRCINPKAEGYCYYGAKGITVCDEWSSFEKFLEDMGERPSPKHSLDRIDGTKGYYKENCRWATIDEQARNKSRNRWLEFNGEKLCIQDWATKLGISGDCISFRLKKGLPLELVLTSKKRPGRHHYLFFKGEEMTLKEIASEIGVNYNSFHGRFTKNNRDLAKTLTHFGASI